MTVGRGAPAPARPRKERRERAIGSLRSNCRRLNSFLLVSGDSQQGQLQGVTHRQPTRLDDVFGAPDGAPTLGPASRFDDHAWLGAGPQVLIHDPDLVVHQVDLRQVGEVRDQRFPHGPVQGVDGTVALSRGVHPLLAHPHPDHRLRPVPVPPLFHDHA